MIRRYMRASRFPCLIASLLLMASANVMADYVPFAGKLQVKLIAIDKPNKVTVDVETWPGFFRNISITLPGITVPQDTAQSPVCERKLAEEALVLTREFLSVAKTVYVDNMRMRTSADAEAMSDIITDNGSLSEALKKAGLARSAPAGSAVSWCE